MISIDEIKLLFNRKNKIDDLTAIVHSHYPVYDVVFSYSWQEWRILSYVGVSIENRIIHCIPMPDEWATMTHEEFEQLIILDKL